MDEYGHDFDWTPEAVRPVTVVLPHPGHGRLVERLMLMISHGICFNGSYYTLSWRDGDVCFYQPAFAEGCCVS